MGTSEATNEAIIESVLKAVKAEQHGENRYRGLCPAHDDHNPSLDIYINADGYLGFHCLSSKKCTHIAIIKAIKEKFNIALPESKRTIKSSGGGRLIKTRVLYPAHESTLPFTFRKNDDILYEYTTATGEVAFIVQRYMDKGEKQTPGWFSIEQTSDEGQVVVQWMCKNPPKDGRPIYNLHMLEHYAKKSILIVEGEKTAEAAMKILQLKDFIVTTWSGGGKNIKASDWRVLKDRQTDIYLWPDHDAEGKKAMQEVANYISVGREDHRLHMLDYSELMDESRVDKAWDLADGYGNQTCDYSFEDLWDTFKPYYSSEAFTSDNIEDALAKRDKHLRKVYMGGNLFVINLNIPDLESPFGFRFYREKHTLMAIDTEKISIEIGERVKSISVVEQWWETRGEHSDVFLDGIKFDPTTDKKELLNKTGRKYLNTFTGFPAFKAKPTDRLIKVWIDHLSKMIDNVKAVDWIIDYFADIFQNPARKPGTAIVFMGNQGVGKSAVYEVLKVLLGTNLARIINKDIMKNNTALVNSLFVYQDEWSVNPYKERLYYEALKNAITNYRLKVEEKYMPAWESGSFCRFAFTSNSNKPADMPMDDRRFTIIKCNNYWLRNKEHFNELFEALKDESALAGMLEFFRNRKITSDLITSYNTIEKEALYEFDSPILREIATWADESTLPSWFRETLGQPATGFGDTDVLIPSPIMREYMENKYKRAYDKAETDRLARLLVLTPNNKTVEIYKGFNTEKLVRRCFILPTLALLRLAIEKEIGRPYNWSTPGKIIEDNVADIIEFKKPKDNKENKDEDPSVI